MKLNIFFRLEKAWVSTRQKLVSSLNYVFCFRENLSLHYVKQNERSTHAIKPKRSFYIEKLLENKSNFKEIFTITNKLLGRNEQLPLPPSDDLGVIAQEFSDFF